MITANSILLSVEVNDGRNVARHAHTIFDEEYNFFGH